VPRALPAVLFDLDGTLVDSIELILSAARHAFAQRPGPTPTDAEWVALIGTPLVDQIRRFAASDDDFELLVAAYRAYQHEHHDRMVRCYDGVLDVVRALHSADHPVAIVTSKGEAMARRALRHVGLDDAIDLVIGADATTRHKPNPDPVLLALERLDVGARDAIFVGDSPHDIAAGNAAGVATVAALWGPFSRETLEAARPSYVIGRIEELAGIVGRWDAGNGG
jgi:pyrophosphatase PpaX